MFVSTISVLTIAVLPLSSVLVAPRGGGSQLTLMSSASVLCGKGGGIVRIVCIYRVWDLVLLFKASKEVGWIDVSKSRVFPPPYFCVHSVQVGAPIFPYVFSLGF